MVSPTPLFHADYFSSPPLPRRMLRATAFFHCRYFAFSRASSMINTAQTICDKTKRLSDDRLTSERDVTRRRVVADIFAIPRRHAYAHIQEHTPHARQNIYCDAQHVVMIAATPCAAAQCAAQASLPLLLRRHARRERKRVHVAAVEARYARRAEMESLEEPARARCCCLASAATACAPRAREPVEIR